MQAEERRAGGQAPAAAVQSRKGGAVPGGARTTADRRESLRAAILEARASRLPRRSAPESRAPAEGDDTALPEPVALANKTGSSDQWQLRQISTLNELLGECYSLAAAEEPELEGEVALLFTISGEPEVGGIIEDVSFDEEGTTLDQPTLRECMQESIYALELDPPPEGVTASRMVTLRFGPD